MPKDIIEGKVSENSIARVSEQHIERLAQHKLLTGDIVYGRRGDIGRQALITRKESGWLCGTGCLRISLGNSPLDAMFLHYFLRDAGVIDGIARQAVGATMPNLNTSILRSIPITYPPISTQRRIASVLSAYDDLVVNNMRRIQILKEMARQIYEEWFVRFRFPGHETIGMTESELGLIPDGWGVVRLEDQYKTGSGGTPSRRNPAFYGGNINWVKTQELNDGFIFESDEKITLDGLNNSSAKVFSTGSVLVAMYGATIGALGILANPSSTNQACCAIIKRREPFGFEFAFLTLLVNRSKLIELRAGAAQQNINQVVIKNFKMMKPDDGTVSAFNHLVNPILKQISMLQKKTDILRRTRDLLLPKLISGEIGVSNFPEPVSH